MFTVSITLICEDLFNEQKPDGGAKAAQAIFTIIQKICFKRKCGGNLLPGILWNINELINGMIKDIIEEYGKTHKQKT